MSLPVLIALTAGLALMLVVSYWIAHCSVLGFNWTTRMPGGLAAALSRPAPLTVRSSYRQTAMLMDHEHYCWVWVKGWMIIVRLEGGDKYVTIPWGCKAYRDIRALVDTVEPVQSYYTRIGEGSDS